MSRRSDLMRSVLVLGSSVARGEGASCPETKGWARLVAEKGTASNSFSTVNQGLNGTTTEHWKAILANPQMRLQVLGRDVCEGIGKFNFIIMSLSLANEGLWQTTNEQQIRMMEKEFCDRYMEIANILRSLTAGGAGDPDGFNKGPRDGGFESSGSGSPSIIMCGPYPNSFYKRCHLESLKRVSSAFRERWDTAKKPNEGNQEDQVVPEGAKTGVIYLDFMEDGVLQQPDTARWLQGLDEDPGHPNDEGHAVMFDIFWKRMEHVFIPSRRTTM